YNYFHSSQIGVNVINNPAVYHNPTVDMHIDKAMAATSNEEALREFKAAQWDGVTGPKVDLPYLWIATVQVPYFVNERLDIGTLHVGERGQGMGILANIDEWQWK
ncbi:MAG: ABC transporter substrate-binding protein, partial [Selenomonas artemidis]|nr:ABC transporter substrate-binding protein [Selenomonas artemidis]